MELFINIKQCLSVENEFKAVMIEAVDHKVKLIDGHSIIESTKI